MNTIAATQSVQYRSVGVILTVKPVRREKVIAVDAQQELSSFRTTTTGVDGSPTLTKRSMVSSLSVEPGEIALLGGLTEDRRTEDRQGFPLLSWLSDGLSSKSSDKTRSEIILVLQAATRRRIIGQYD